MLDQTVPGLSDQLRLLSIQQQRRVVAQVCDLVGQSITGLEEVVRNTLTVAVERNTLSSSEIVLLRDYAANADKRYFTLQEEGVEQAIWWSWFAKARLATALADVFSNEELETVTNAVYELCFIEPDNSRIISLVKSKINAVT